MYLCQRDVLVRREQCRALRHQAERERLTRRVLVTIRTARYRRALHSLGGRLHAWGQRLMDLGASPAYGERLT
jgi:hypothetical protein